MSAPPPGTSASLVVTLRAGTSLFHGNSVPRALDPNDAAFWMGDETTARGYGRFIHEFRLTRDLVLLDVSNPVFHADFTGRVNHMYTGQRLSGMDGRKERALAPLGIPDVRNQTRVLGARTGGFYTRPSDPLELARFDKIDWFVGYFDHHHRYSFEVDGVNPDHEMVQAMRVAYPDVDGYTCPIMWPSIHHGGFMLPETCVFAPVTSGVVRVGEPRNTQGGGGRGSPRARGRRSSGRQRQMPAFNPPPRFIYDDPEYGEIWVTTGPGFCNVYDADGVRTWPTYV